MKIPRYYIIFSFFLIYACQHNINTNTVTDNIVIKDEKKEIPPKIDTNKRKEVAIITPPKKIITKKIPPKKVETQPKVLSNNNYPWLSGYDKNNNLFNRIEPPAGYKRLQVKHGSFADWLRHLPLKPDNSNVLLFDGREKTSQDIHIAVVDIDTGDKDLQQCADAVMRLKAEYHYSRQEFEKIHFNFTNGTKVSFDDWRKNKRPIIKNDKVSFSKETGKIDNSYSNFKKYMNIIFYYAGTYSLSKELKSIAVSDILPGNVFIRGGFPGHAVIVVDMAVNAQGEKLFLLAQSYMPAQDIHILKNLMNAGLSPWYSQNFGEELNTPEWTFYSDQLMKFEE